MRCRILFTHSTILAVSSALVLLPVPGVAGDLNAEVEQMFRDLESLGNYTAPGAFKGQTFNTYSGGTIYLRTPNKTYQIVTMQYPSAKAGCGGIDVFGGSFSHISATEFKNMLRNITAALPGIAFQLALESVSPLLGGLTKWAKGLETAVNNARIGSCETANALVSSAAEAAGYNSQETCAKLAVQLGLETDADSARRRCATDRPAILRSARSSPDPYINAQAPFVGNLTWQALKDIDGLDDAAREVIMSIIGTVIFYPEEAGRAPEPVAPTITKISHLLYGQSDAGDGNIRVQLLKCNNYSACDVVSAPSTYLHTPITKKVETLMRSIATKIANRTPIPNDSAEVGFVNRTSEPVWRMLSLGSSIPGSGLARLMIEQYREIIAADYAYNLLSHYLRTGTYALERRWRLDQVQRKRASEIASRASNMLTLLAQEKAALSARRTAIGTATASLEQIERELRSNMPQHVIDMLEFSANALH